MKWKDRELKTYGDLAAAFTACETPEEANFFLDEYVRAHGNEREGLEYLLDFRDSGDPSLPLRTVLNHRVVRLPMPSVQEVRVANQQETAEEEYGT